MSELDVSSTVLSGTFLVLVFFDILYFPVFFGKHRDQSSVLLMDEIPEGPETVRKTQSLYPFVNVLYGHHSTQCHSERRPYS